MKILITGALGFIGRQVLQTLAALEKTAFPRAEVLVIDKNDVVFPYSEVRFTFKRIIADITTLPPVVLQELSDTDVIIHLAASVHDASITEKEHMRVNYLATRDLVKQFIDRSRSAVKQFIFASSVAVFGSYKDSEYSEADNCHPDTAYAKSKLRAERFIQSLGSTESGAFKYTILRFATVYGVHDRGNIGKMINFMRKFHVFPVFNAHVKKSFIYVKDVARAIVECINNDRVFNEALILSGPSVTMEETIDLIRSVLNINCIRIRVPFWLFAWSSMARTLNRNNQYSLHRALTKLNFSALPLKDGLLDMNLSMKR